MMHPKRKFRLIAIPICLLVILVCNLMIMQWISRYEKKYARMGETTDNQTVGKMIISHLSGYHSPVTGPARGLFYAFMKTEAVATRKPFIPHMAAPHSLFMHFIAGYKFRGKFVYDSPTLPEANIPRSQIEALLDKPPKPEAKLGYASENDADWEIRVARAESHDTLYFHAVVVDVHRVYENIPALFDSALAQYPYVFHVPSTDPKQQFKDRYDESRVIIYEGNKILYQRGDTTNCMLIHSIADTVKQPWLPGHKIGFAVYRSNNINWPKLLSSRTNRILLEITIAFLFMMLASWAIGYYRGYSIQPKQRAKEMEWEKEHSK